MSRIVTFYSYKGGVGRSMTLANVAVLLARRGQRVLVVDWDLEAPGLERYFEVFESQPSRGGLLPLLEGAHAGFGAGPVPVDTYEAHVTRVFVGGGPPIAMLGSGRTDAATYAGRLAAFDWGTFYRDGGGDYLERLRDRWKQDYDVVLVDSRTGLSDSGGICTIQMPDVLVAMFTANHQSVLGVRDVILAAKEGRQRLAYDRMQLAILPLPSRFATSSEFQRSQEWLDRFVESFADCVTDWLPAWVSPRQLFERLKVPQVDWFGFGERLAVVEHGTSDPAGMGFAFERVTDLLASDFHDLEGALGTVARKPADWKPSTPTVAATQRPNAVDGQGYDFDLYVSYSNSGGVVGDWVRDFVAAVSDWLGLELPTPARVFYDAQNVAVGDSLPERLESALRSSKVLLAILTPAYFTSPWCLREWAEFVALSRATDSPRIVPIVLRGMSTLPSPVRQLEVLDGSATLTAGRSANRFDSSPETARLLKETVGRLVRLLERTPPRPEFPVEADPALIAALAKPPARIDAQRILALCSEIVGEFKDAYLQPRIPPAILRSARERFLDEHDDVLAILDNSYKGTDGLAILSSGIAWRNNYQEPARRKSWDELVSLPRIKSDNDEDDVVLSPGERIDFSGSEIESAAVAKLLREIVKTIT